MMAWQRRGYRLWVAGLVGAGTLAAGQAGGRGMRAPWLVARAGAAVAEKGTPAEGAVRIRIDRAERVGQKSEITVKVSNRESVVTTRAGALPEEKKTHAEGTLRALREVLAVGKSGRATQVRLLIRALKFSGNPLEMPRDVLPSGAVVDAEYGDGTTRFTIGGKPVDAALDEALQSFWLLYDGPSSDLVFRTNVPRRVGESWQPDLREIAREEAYQAYTFDLAASSGKVTLGPVRKEQGQDCHILEVEVNLVPNGMAGQEGVDLTGSAVRFKAVIPVPVDPTASEPGTRREDEAVLRVRFGTGAKATRVEAVSKALRDEETSGK